jgi:hypothetical protein
MLNISDKKVHFLNNHAYKLGPLDRGKKILLKGWKFCNVAINFFHSFERFDIKFLLILNVLGIIKSYYLGFRIFITSINYPISQYFINPAEILCESKVTINHNSSMDM